MVLLGLLMAGRANGQARRIESLNADWKFAVGEQKGAQAEAFEDSKWRVVNVPHDWSIEGPFRQENPSGQGGAFLPGGVGWYRKRFTLNEKDMARRVFVELDGVMANSEVWINGFALGRRPNGTVGLRYDLTGHLHFGAQTPNLLAVRADNASQPASRWYSGAGIYRPVRLVVTAPVHLATDTTFLSTPKADAMQAIIRVQSSVLNQSAQTRSVALRIVLNDPEGRPVQTVETAPQSAIAGKTVVFTRDIAVEKPALWNLERPALYTATLTVLEANKPLDAQTTKFGIRTARFEAATGFWLNGKNIKIKGVCLHQEAGGLGIAVPRSVWEQRLTLLKQFGVNAVRTGHNPFGPEFLDVCDRLGLLVLDEMFDCWTVGKNPYDYHLAFGEWAERDAGDIVRQDRNHPCVILYSIGNEIRDTPNGPSARRTLTSLRDTVHQTDPTRPVTQALFRPNTSHDYENGLADMLDVIGQNYRENELLAAHRAKPERKILGTENGHDRRVWLALRDNPAYAGQFLWTGIDYLGEGKRWPAISADFGLFDRTMTPRPIAFERRSWWSDEPMVAIARRVAPTPLTPTDPGYEAYQSHIQTLYSDWTPRSLAPHEERVEVYSNCEQVELLLNGVSLGTQNRPDDASPRLWKVGFASGTLQAIGKNKGKEVALCTLRTAGAPARLVLTTDRSRLAADGQEVACVHVTVTDANGILVPNAQPMISFQLTGPGLIAAVDNGDLNSHESFQAHERHAFQGRCLVLLRATAPAGSLTLTASTPGLAPASLTLKTIAR